MTFSRWVCKQTMVSYMECYSVPEENISNHKKIQRKSNVYGLAEGATIKNLHTVGSHQSYILENANL